MSKRVTVSPNESADRLAIREFAGRVPDESKNVTCWTLVGDTSDT
jgi:hypothetical protein